jgi:signal transduction histidine kinase
MGCFRLDPESRPDDAVPRHGAVGGLTRPILLQNARWFTRIRWLVIAILAGFGGGSFLLCPSLLESFGFSRPGLWPLILAGLLALLNQVSGRWIRHLAVRTPCSWNNVSANIWFQIVTDLAVLSIVVYQFGPTTTVIGFAYLFHITLACIFFGRRDSFMVTVLSVGLFLGTVVLKGLLLPPAASATNTSALLSQATFALPAVFVWVIVWYLTSSLSETVRRRDRDLAEANRRILQADQDINLRMLRVTHDLKAPFSGIESNIQLLKHLHWDETPESVRQLVEKIDARSMSLRTRIGDILLLGSLRSAPSGDPVSKPIMLRGLLESVLQDVHGLAAGKDVSVSISGGDVTVLSDPYQLKILFSNLISNAIIYSRSGGTVEVKIEKPAAQAIVRIDDHGIGISEDALPHIFEDFYRSQEAAAFNPNSMGFGLAIVRQIVRNLGLSIAVESEQERGTTFQVYIQT